MKSQDGTIVGMITSTILMNKIVKKKVCLKDPVKLAVIKEYRNMTSDMPLHELSRVL